MATLPFSIALGRPTRGELLSLAGAAILVGSVVGWISTTARPAPPAAADDPPTETASLDVTSTPPGAAILVDGQPQGTTPATVAVLPGHHEVVLQAAGAVEERRGVRLGPDGARLHLSLWRARPTITYLKPPLPGAALTDAVFLTDGRVALQISLPDDERQAWTLDPDAHLASQRLGAVVAHAPLAVQPDGRTIATLQPRADGASTSSSRAWSDHPPAGEVWLIPTDGDTTPRRVWTAPELAEDLVDLDWAPDQRHLLLVGRQPLSGGAARTVVRRLDTGSGEAEDVALLPSEVVPGTDVWSPDGRTVAFVVHTASLAAVCTLAITGDFRYLGDLGHDGLLGPPVAPVAWAPDGRLLYGALLGQGPPSPSASPFSQHPAGLFLTSPGETPGRPISTTAALVPLWRADGRILALGLPAGQDSGLRLRDLDGQGAAQDVGTIEVPTPGPTAYGVRWDVAHRRGGA